MVRGGGRFGVCGIDGKMDFGVWWIELEGLWRDVGVEDWGLEGLNLNGGGGIEGGRGS